MTKMSVGIDLGGTRVKGLLLVDGMIKDKCSVETQEQGNWRDQVIQVFKRITAPLEGSRIAIGLSAPGIARSDNRAIAHLPNRLLGLEDLNWSEVLHAETWVLNDAHAALLAEAKLGAGSDLKNLVMLTLGTGVGGGLLIDGQIYQGFLQRAGHLGHVCVEAASDRPSITGMTGSLEEAVGEVSLAARSLGKFKTTEALVKAFVMGDYWATWVWLNSVRKLALAISSMINALSPNSVILAGGITKAGDHLMRPLSMYLDLYEWRPGGVKTPIHIAQFDEYAGAIGAAIYARQREEMGASEK